VKQDKRIFGGSAVTALRAALTLGLMTLCAATMLLVALPTFFRARNFYHQKILVPFGRAVLAVWGIQLELHQTQAFPQIQTIYISNHTSTLDMFVLIALGLPNTRFFLSGYLRWLLPMGLIGYLLGIFWTVDQKFSARRVRIFKRAAEALQRSGESVYLSPEGERVTSGEIGHFNKGAFHLATVLHAPIVPIYIAIPKAIDPGRGWCARPGVVHVYIQPSVATTQWALSNLERNRDQVRDLFLAWHTKLNAGLSAEHKR